MSIVLSSLISTPPSTYRHSSVARRAFACWNRYRSFPRVKSVEKRFAARGLRVVGVHAPELDRERVRENVVAKVREYGPAHPVMIDEDLSYWRALGNRYWPTFYVLDAGGRIRGVFVGETHSNTPQAGAVERLIDGLLRA